MESKTLCCRNLMNAVFAKVNLDEYCWCVCRRTQRLIIVRFEIILYADWIELRGIAEALRLGENLRFWRSNGTCFRKFSWETFWAHHQLRADCLLGWRAPWERCSQQLLCRADVTLQTDYQCVLQLGGLATILEQVLLHGDRLNSHS